MNRIMLYFLNMEFINVFWFIASFHLISGIKFQNDINLEKYLKEIQEDADREIEKSEFCNNLQIRDVLIFTDEDIVRIFFGISDVKFIDCFKYFNVTLERKRRPVRSDLISYNEEVSFKFENVSCGMYQVLVRPCKSNWQCAPWHYPISVNMTSNCLNTVRTTETLIFNESIRKEIIISTALFSVLLVFAVGILVYLIKHRLHGRTDNGIDFEGIDYGIVNGENSVGEVKRIHVYIFHYYDEENVIKARVEILRDFLVQSSYYSTVKVIDGELPEILNNPNDWLNKAFEEKAEDGGIIKIIIIDAKENNMGEDFENLIYIQAIATLYSDICRSCTAYDTLFVARLRGIPAYSERIRRIVRGHRYSIPDHLIDLCLNLCSGSGLDLSTVERSIKRLFLNHPIKYLGVVQNV